MKIFFLLIATAFMLSACDVKSAQQHEIDKINIEKATQIRIEQARGENQRLINQDNLASSERLAGKTYRFLLKISNVVLWGFGIAVFGYLVHKFMEHASNVMQASLRVKADIARYETIQVLALSGKDLATVSSEIRAIS